MILKITYASCYVYSPAGAGAVCERSRLLRALLKAGDAHFMLKYAVRVHQQAADSPQLADALVHAGVGTMVWRGLHRICPVRKSATSAPGARPSVSRHYESFLIERPPKTLARVVLIDDVVTKGR